MGDGSTSISVSSISTTTDGLLSCRANWFHSLTLLPDSHEESTTRRWLFCRLPLLSRHPIAHLARTPDRNQWTKWQIKRINISNRMEMLLTSTRGYNLRGNNMCSPNVMFVSKPKEPISLFSIILFWFSSSWHTSTDFVYTSIILSLLSHSMAKFSFTVRLLTCRFARQSTMPLCFGSRLEVGMGSRL